MPPQPMSPRLPGVSILAPEATGPQYRRWRRGVKNAFISRGTWGYCDGSCPMPMPTQGPNFFAPTSTPEPQPELLEERRAWSRKDRDVKLDIFLSVADDIKLDVFEVGPALPPPGMSALEMIQALDGRFEEFKFEDYHHAFCHFLNLHIDQYGSLGDFNIEFVATLEDLLDHGYPLDNVQACSAYFSKMRCTQNPWVVKKLNEWDTLATPPLLADLIKDCPPWHVIKPLALKAPSQPTSESYSEDLAESQGEEELSEDAASISSDSSREQEITVHASYEDLTEAFPIPTSVAELPATPIPIPQRISSKEASQSALSPLSLSSPANKALPSLPKSSTSSTRSASPKPGSESHLKVPPASPRPRTPKSPAPRPSAATPPGISSPNLLPPSPPKMIQRRPTSSRSAILPIPLGPQSSMETFTTWPPRSPLIRQDSSNSSIISLPLQGTTIPEFPRTKLSVSPPNTPPVKSSMKDCDEDLERLREVERQRQRDSIEKHQRKRSWSIKSRWSARRGEVS
ncbi:uncharacterized protein BDR25DRAFT_300654 [Lindgomyces ingoldianus]|uniref:Uncharacterized protein n=1 Tax=Lindgomyces ingoldianus TaxID=673940 RepID=A0ACB6RA37_9PLEO|nr:uncharacterized protein BDR25DRAFT_300654 [Lindgomyces ingoldianus]KAF2475628.1 hypothetical protein BDR25DRAFT_300654 [Lindgomyces ingoldianus]